MRRSLVVLLLVTATTLLASLVAVPTPVQAAPSASAYLAEARKYTNHERTKAKRPVLVNSECLARFARAQAARMAKRGEIYHTTNFSAIGKTCGLRAWAENVAYVYGSDTGRGVVRAWMGSEGHRTNILNPTYRHLGMGAVYRDDKWWVVQVFGRVA